MLLTNPTIFLMDFKDIGSKALMGFGRKRLKQLHRDMRFQQLNTYSSKIDLGTGYTVIATSSQGINKIIIISPKEKEAKRDVEYECFCNCNFAIGRIQALNVVGSLIYMTVSTCIRDRFALFENVLASDFTPWAVSDVVIVMAYNKMLYDCDNEIYDATGCSPKKDAVNNIGDSAWRTTVRVLPLCTFNHPKWIKYASPV